MRMVSIGLIVAASSGSSSLKTKKGESDAHEGQGAAGHRCGQRHGRGDGEALRPRRRQDVFVADMLDKEGAAVVAEIGRQAARRTFVHLDVTNEDTVEGDRRTRHIEPRPARRTVNNAGISGSAEQDLYDTAAWNSAVNVNPRASSSA